MAFADEILGSLYDPRVYRAAARRGRLRSTLQLARVALLSAVCFTTAATLFIASLWKERVAPVLDAIPTITIKNGVATVEGPQPWARRVIRDAAGHDWVIVLDTTGRTTELGAAERGVLLTRTEVRLKSTASRVDAMSLSRVGDVKLGPKALRRALLARLMLVPPALLAASLLWHLLAKGLQALLLASWMGRRTLRRRSSDDAPAAVTELSFAARLGIASHALVAPVLLECATWWVPVPTVLAWPAYLALAGFYAAAGQRQVELDEADPK